MLIEAKDFAGKSNDGYQFGIADRESIIRGLLKVVGGLIDFSLLPQSIALNAKIGIDDYLLHDLTITYAETNHLDKNSFSTRNLEKSCTLSENVFEDLKNLFEKAEKVNGC